MWTERKPRLQWYDFRHEAVDYYRHATFHARIYPCCHAAHLRTLISEGIQGLKVLSPSRSRFATLTRPSRFSMPTYLTMAVEDKVTWPLSSAAESLVFWNA